jgi:DNA-binding FrmR family transcriptional regulator
VYPTGYHAAVDIEEPLAGELMRRLRRIEGQVSAASKALDQVGFKLLANGLASCLSHPDDAEYSLQEVEQMFLKLS